MKQTIINEVLGEIVYEESPWTGKKSLSVNGKPLDKIDKNTFRLDTGEYAVIKGSYLMGAKLTIGNETIRLSESVKWYEIAIAVLTFMISLVWGNSPTLVQIFPMVGGAIGGALSCAGGLFSLVCMKKVKNPLVKILIGLGFFVLTVFVLYLVAVAIISAMA